MAQHRVRSAGEKRGGFVGEPIDSAMADEVNARMDGNQPARSDPALNHGRCEPRGEQLPASDDPFLSACEIRQEGIKFSRWCVYTTQQRRDPGDSPPGAAT
jgi:hypothetical protein